MRSRTYALPPPPLPTKRRLKQGSRLETSPVHTSRRATNTCSPYLWHLLIAELINAVPPLSTCALTCTWIGDRQGFRDSLLHLKLLTLICCRRPRRCSSISHSAGCASIRRKPSTTAGEIKHSCGIAPGATTAFASSRHRRQWLFDAGGL